MIDDAFTFMVIVKTLATFRAKDANLRHRECFYWQRFNTPKARNAILLVGHRLIFHVIQSVAKFKGCIMLGASWKANGDASCQTSSKGFRIVWQQEILILRDRN